MKRNGGREHTSSSVPQWYHFWSLAYEADHTGQRGRTIPKTTQWGSENRAYRGMRPSEPGCAPPRDAAGERRIPEIPAFQDRNTVGNQASPHRAATAVGPTGLHAPNCWGTGGGGKAGKDGCNHSHLCEALRL